MTCIRKAVILLSLLLHEVCCDEPEPVFRPEGGDIEMGYCFAVDYIVVYRSTAEGEQVLGNSSDQLAPVTPPVEFQGRVHGTNIQHMLGLKISVLTDSDSGVYRRECWKNGTLINKRTHQLYVCDKETESEGVVQQKEDGKAEVLCNSTFIGLEGTSIRWYHDSYPSYKRTLFLDSSVSLEPLVPDLRDTVTVGLNGALLSVANSVLFQSHQFSCLVIKNGKCLSFQNIYVPDNSETVQVFVSQGDRLVLNCTTGDKDQQWDTPMGHINTSTKLQMSPDSAMNMHISGSKDSGSYSLVIPAVSEKHIGEYVCVSPSAEVEYNLVLCPKKEHKEKAVSVSGSVSLQCDISREELQIVQWYRQEMPAGYSLIYNSDDQTAPVPEDLKGRVSISNDSSSLTLSNVMPKDFRTYWCVVLRDSEFIESYEDYSDDEKEDPTEEDDYSSNEYSWDTARCISKQVTNVILPKTETRSESGTTSEPPVAHNTVLYAVVGGLIGLLLLAGVIAAVIVMMKRTQAPRGRREAERSLNQDMRMNEDSECTTRLRHSDESEG